MPKVVLLGTLDTKPSEFGYLRQRLVEHGCQVVLVDAGIFEPGPGAPTPDITGHEVAAAAGTTRAELQRRGDRGAAVELMGRGLRAVVEAMASQGDIDAILVAGGSGAATLGSAAMARLPLGLPKVIVSTIAAGDTRPYIALRDITLIYPVVDIAGLDQMARAAFDNAAAAVAGMARLPRVWPGRDRRVVAATMFGVTTAGVSQLRQRLEQLGHEVWTFHASGYGGRSMESLIRSGSFLGMADVTTTELADELVGGVCSAGPERLEAAALAGLPQVVSTGALDMVNFGPRATVPHRLDDRLMLRHNQNVTLVRTDANECAQLGKLMAEKLNRARGPVRLFAPTRGMSAVSVQGAPFFDPEADRALIEALVPALTNPLVEVSVVDTDINDPELARTMAESLDELLQGTQVPTSRPSDRSAS